MGGVSFLACEKKCKIWIKQCFKLQSFTFYYPTTKTDAVRVQANVRRSALLFAGYGEVYTPEILLYLQNSFVSPRPITIFS